MMECITTVRQVLIKLVYHRRIKRINGEFNFALIPSEWNFCMRETPTGDYIYRGLRKDDSINENDLTRIYFGFNQCSLFKEF